MQRFKTLRGVYVISAASVWTVIIIASAQILGAAGFQKLWPILAGDTVYFVILVPGAYMWQRQSPD